MSEGSPETNTPDTDLFNRQFQLAFCKAHAVRLLGCMPLPLPDVPLPFVVESAELLEISEADISGIFHRFPIPAQQRIGHIRFVAEPTLWSSQDRKQTTRNIAEALSPYSFRTGLTHILEDEVTISMFSLRDIPLPETTKYILQMYACFHEFAHALVGKDLFSSNDILQIPGGRSMQVGEALLFINFLISRFPDLSNYFSHYHGGDLDDIMMLQEGAAEMITMFLLGFGFISEKKRQFNPFYQVPEVKNLIRMYLSAHRVALS